MKKEKRLFYGLIIIIIMILALPVSSMALSALDFIAVNPERVKLDKESIQIEPQKTAIIIATVEPENATNKTVTYSSSNTDVATVDDNGTITAKKEGTADIIAKTVNGKTATCKVTVKNPEIEVTEIKLSKTSMNLEVGKTEQLKATISPENATNKTVTYSSSNSKIAKVENGKVTAVAAGKATITAKTSNGKESKCSISVIENINSNVIARLKGLTTNYGPRYSLIRTNSDKVVINLKDDAGISSVKLEKYVDKKYTNITKDVTISEDKKTVTVSKKLIGEAGSVTHFRLSMCDTSSKKCNTIAIFTIKVLSEKNENNNYFTVNYAPGLSLSLKDYDYIRLSLTDSTGMNLEKLEIKDKNNNNKTIYYKIEENKGTNVSLLIRRTDLTKKSEKYYLTIKALDKSGQTIQQEIETKALCDVTVKKGSNNMSVKYLQQCLNDIGEDLEVDGYFGSVTQTAVKKFQEEYNLEVDGVVGKQTWGKLLYVINNPGEKEKEEETNVLQLNRGPRYSIKVNNKDNVVINLTEKGKINEVELRKYVNSEWTNVTNKIKISSDKKTLTIPKDVVGKEGEKNQFVLGITDSSSAVCYTVAIFKLEVLKEKNASGNYYVLNNAPRITLSSKSSTDDIKLLARDDTGIDKIEIKDNNSNKIISYQKGEVTSNTTTITIKRVNLTKKNGKYSLIITVTDKAGMKLVEKLEITAAVDVSSKTTPTSNKGDGYSKTIKLGGRTFKLYKQYSGSYANKHFNSVNNSKSWGTISDMGCGPSSIAIVLSGYGFNKNPYDIGKLLMKNGTPSGLPSMEKEVKALGMKAVKHTYSSNYTKTYNEIKTALESGHQIVLYVGKNAPKDYWYNFTHSGYHFISILGIDSSNDKVYVGNPGVSSGWFSLSTVVKARGNTNGSMAGWLEIYK